MNRDDTYYEALQTRDPRFDGKFFVGVKTTGIYCRPICPAKPKRQNVEFFANHVAAEHAGYRPCLRCRPESAPRSPAWIGKSAVVQRAVKILHRPQALDLNEDRFAALFGVSARHLRRLFIDELGKTPKQLSSENRLNLSRQLLTETPLAVSEVAHASGFQSLRRFNDAFRERFKKSPSEIRRHKTSNDKGLRLSLAYRPPFDYEGLLRIYKSHQTGGLEWFEGEKMFRVVALNGKVGTVSISNDPEHARLWLDIDFPDPTLIPEIVARTRALFDLDSDPLIIANSLESDPAIGKLLRRHPGIRLPSGWDPFEVAVSAILGQLVSVDFGRTLVNDLIELTGRDSGLMRDGVTIKLFPTPYDLAEADLTSLKTTGVRKQTLRDFARAVADGKLSLESTQNVDEFVAAVRAIRGIGPWTANYMAMKVLRHTDAFPATDLILARALSLHSAEALEAMSPWRGYVAALFWRAYSGKLKKSPSRRKK